MSDAEIASWADQIKRERPNTRPYHYVNIPIDAKGYDEKRDGNKGNSLLLKITEFEAVLADKTKPKAERAEALKFIVHLVGDLEQPLHVAERNKDKGGNSRLVFFLDRAKATNLHTVWDTDLLRQYVGKHRIADYSDGLNRDISKNTKESWVKGTIEQWANESLIVAVNEVYADIPIDGPPPKIDVKYVVKHRETIEKQLAKGGIRLAEILKRALSERK